MRLEKGLTFGKQLSGDFARFPCIQLKQIILQNLYNNCTVREFSDKYSLHLVIALQIFKVVSLVNMVSLFCSICATNVRNSSFYQDTLIFHLAAVYHLS